MSDAGIKILNTLRAGPSQSLWRLHRLAGAAWRTLQRLIHSRHRGHSLQAAHAAPSLRKSPHRFEQAASLDGTQSWSCFLRRTHWTAMALIRKMNVLIDIITLRNG